MSAPSVLLIARHYPPAISGGARRPYLLARGLRALGAHVFVIAPDAPPEGEGLAVPHPHRDPAPSADGPAAPRMLRDIAREWLLWPDPDIRWTRRAAAAAAGGLPFRPDLVITTSPPESLHWAGAALKRRFGSVWVADFRDEWLARPFRSVRRSPARAAIERVLARRLLATADAITCVDETVARDAAALAPPERVHVLGQFADAPPPPERLSGEGPHLLYTGSFAMSDPSCRIEPTLDAFAAAAPEAAPGLTLHLIGRLTPSELTAVERCAARAQIRVHGTLSYERVRALQAGADGFVVTAAPDATAVPGKVYEYRAVGAPIIAVGDGPWRAIGGYVPGDAVERMRALRPRVAGVREGFAPWTPEEAARAVLDLASAARSAL